MAIDTQNKRRSTIYVLPVPDGTIDQADRQQALYIYSGILVTGIVVTSGQFVYNVPAEDRVYNVPAEDRVHEVLP